MTERQTKQHGMLVRVRKFGSEHHQAFPDGSEGAAALAAIDAAITTLEASATSEHKTLKQGLVKKAEAKRVLRAQIKGVAKSARIIARTDPGADSPYQLPPRYTDLGVLSTARAFLHEAPAMKEAFVRYGLAPTFIDDLQQATDTFAKAADHRIDGKQHMFNARAGLRSSVVQAMSAVTALDVIVGNVFGKQPLVMDNWKEARRVVPPRAAVVPPTEAVPASASQQQPPQAGEVPLQKAS